MSVENVGLSDLLEQVARGEIALLHTGLPAFIVSYDETTQKATVQPVVRAKRIDLDGEVEHYKLPPITNVPVYWPQGGGLSLTLPVDEGDWVWLSFGERSLDEWLATAEQDNEARAVRRFNLADAVAWAGVRPFADPLQNVPTDRARLGHPDPGARVEVTKSTGKIRIGTDAAELLSLLGDLIDALQAATVATALGPQPLDLTTQTALLNIESLLNQIKE